MKNICVLLALIGVFASCEKKEEIKEFVIQGTAQGSTYAIKYVSESEVVSKKQIDSIFAVIDNSMSTWVPTSIVSKVNDGDTLVVVDDHFKKVMKASERIFMESDSLFDPTVGTLMKVYGFGPKKQIKHLSREQLDSVMDYIGLEKVRLRPDGTISKLYPEIYMDFNSIAQGYSVDVLVDFLKANGINNAIVEVGGELAAIGTNTLKDKNWVVGIDDPLQDPYEPRKLIARINIQDLGMATSGNYRKVILDTVTGEKYVHTMNPKTGLPQKGTILSATVLAEKTMRADGLATAFMTMDVDKSIGFLKMHPEIYAYFIYMDDSNKEQFYQTENFKKLMLE
ncbi:FAD:protein FMN transferase [Neptunitalea chrysea]|uniref:FAD:protein FMN transferase n=1 Tax=Neptunitalea chrysea TaxID=1647581 RepID=A0A9W6EUV8_9FLAO|nr:FAD:protein FMN transferase [Neptunitalea chrysea]GLB52191.1 FAD:protein FMN transferase [Neptunitalea chrysea]